MMDHLTGEGEERGGQGWTVRSLYVEVVVAAILFLVGIAMMVDSQRIGAGWADGNLQSGYFPFKLGVIISIISALIFGISILRRSEDARTFVSATEFGRVMLVLVPTVLYVIGMQFVGIYVSSTLYIAFFMLTGGRQGWIKTLAVSVGTSVAVFVLFEIIFLIPLPKGPVEALFGY